MRVIALDGQSSSSVHTACHYTTSTELKRRREAFFNMRQRQLLVTAGRRSVRRPKDNPLFEHVRLGVLMIIKPTHRRCWRVMRPRLRPNGNSGCCVLLAKRFGHLVRLRFRLHTISYRNRYVLLGQCRRGRTLWLKIHTDIIESYKPVVSRNSPQEIYEFIFTCKTRAIDVLDLVIRHEESFLPTHEDRWALVIILQC